MKKKILKLSVRILIVACIALLLGSYYMLGVALAPPAMDTKARNIEGSYAEMLGAYPQIVPWVDSLKTNGLITDVYIDNARGEHLHGIYIKAPKPTHKTAVLVHGWTDNAVRMMHMAYMYNNALEYNVLIPELHGHGLNEPASAQMGWLDRLDVLVWIDKANELFATAESDASIVVHGISMGAATTMMVSGEVGSAAHPMPFVKCFVEDCGYTGVEELFNYHISHDYSLPVFPVIPIASAMCKMLNGWSFSEASALKSIAHSRRPMLFIHSDNDDFVPSEMVYPLYEANPNEKEIWITKAKGHARSYREYPEEYTKKVRMFVEKYM